MKLMAAMIAALSLISTTYAQGQHTHNRRKSEPMQTMNDIAMVTPALEKYAQGPLADLETPRPHATRSQHCYDLGPNRAQPND